MEGQPADAARDQVMEVVRRSFRPEFLNRLDEIILFNRLGRNEMKRIVDIQLKHLQKLLADRKIVLDINEKAKTWLANTGYDPVYGARPLKRVIQRHLQNPLATMLLSGTIKDGETVRVSVQDGQLAINGSKLAQAA
jgi:ATP-dependent Clp protease ATP-binding subunit ClpB